MPSGTEVDLGPGHIVLHLDPAPRAKGAHRPHCFRPVSVVATVAHLSYCSSLVNIKILLILATFSYCEFRSVCNNHPTYALGYSFKSGD